MRHKSYIAAIFLQSIAIISATSVFAQEPGKKQTIDITSSFKPVLKPAAKINFDAAPPVPDSAKPRFSYNIPVTSLSRLYQPLSISPLALNIDSTHKWSASNFVKLGYGNYQTPFAQAGLTFTNGTNSTLNILGNFISSKGSAIEHQAYGRANAAAYGSTTLAGKQELYGKLSFDHDLYYKYGYDHSLYNYSKNSLRQRFLNFGANIGFRNTEPTEFGLKYHPDVKLNFFSDNHNAKEFNGIVNLPLQKSISDAFTIKLAANADFTQLSKSGQSGINNTFVTIPIGLQFKNEIVNIHGGAIPSWDNSDFKLLPDVMADFKLGGDGLIVQLGWLMHYEKGSYKRFASINPYLSQPNDLFNTRINETYGGIKGTFMERFFYNIKVGLAQFYNMPLFVNDTSLFSDGKSFAILKEEKLNAFQVHGEAGVVQAEDFSLTAKFDWMLFNKQKTYAEPWGIIPRELTMAMRWRVLKDLWLKSDLFFFEGAKYRQQNGSTDQGTHPVDLNAGLEFRVTKRFNLWVQANNVFNNKYQRWHQYQVYGFNILGGIVFNFSK